MASNELVLESTVRSFGGRQCIYSHDSIELGCNMRLAVYIPPGCDFDNRMPVVYWLSGLTCSETNFIEKSGAQRYAAELGLVIVCPDTSPRGHNLPGDRDAWDFGVGASFYVDATRRPFAGYYRMCSYLIRELMPRVSNELPVVAGRQSIAGHSMGGHGALVLALRNPGLFRSASALAPIANPIRSAWGQKAFTGYLGDTDAEREEWRRWDATELVRDAAQRPDDMRAANELHLLVDQGGADLFLEQLLPHNLVAACRESGVELEYASHEGYDHSFYFVSSFIGKHLAHHRKYLE